MADADKFTHRFLVEAAYRWIIKKGGCGVAFKEFNTAACNGEYPDVIGFSSWGKSVLIECKTSRSDFFADRKKSFRAKPELGMGTNRYYCCPVGLLKQEDLPEGWGLLYVSGLTKTAVVYKPIVHLKNEEGNPYRITYRHEKNMKAEHGLMYSALRRLHIRGRIDEIYTPLSMVGQEETPDFEAPQPTLEL